jgi:hypothetical protein
MKKLFETIIGKDLKYNFMKNAFFDLKNLYFFKIFKFSKITTDGGRGNYISGSKNKK